MHTIEAALAHLRDATQQVAQRSSLSETFAWIAEQYRNVRLPETDLDADGDLLLYQWGVMDWGDGLFAIIDLTRQIQVAAASPSGDPSAWQIGCRFRFPPPLLNRIKNGSCWCPHPRELTDFYVRLEQSDPWLRLSQATPLSSLVRLTRV